MLDSIWYNHWYNEKYHREILIWWWTDTQLYSLLIECRNIHDYSNYDNWSKSLGLIDDILRFHKDKSDTHGDYDYSQMLIAITQEYKISIIDKMLQEMPKIFLHRKIRRYTNNIKNLLQNNLTITKRE